VASNIGLLHMHVHVITSWCRASSHNVYDHYVVQIFWRIRDDNIEIRFIDVNFTRFHLFAVKRELTKL